MNPKKQRIAIAEACGWKFSCIDKYGCSWHFDPNGKEDFSFCAMPDYLENLNDMHEAEKILSDHQYECFWLELWDITTDKERPIHNESAPIRFERAYLSATATQRAEAFLKTLGLWEEEPK